MSLTEIFEPFTLLDSSSDVVTKVAPVSPVAEAYIPKKNVFTVSHANRAPCPAAAAAIPLRSRDDYEVQLAQVRCHREALHKDFVARHEAATAAVSEADRRIGVKIMLRLAAERDVACGKAASFPAPVVQFMRTSWQAFLRQVETFLDGPCEQIVDCGDGTMMIAANTLSTAALENISSLGVWFSGPNISLPLRQYAVQVPGTDSEQPQTIVVVGLATFAYSNYILQMRSIAQQTFLAELRLIEEQLGTRCLFAPQLLVAEHAQ